MQQNIEKVLEMMKDEQAQFLAQGQASSAYDYNSTLKLFLRQPNELIMNILNNVVLTLCVGIVCFSMYSGLELLVDRQTSLSEVIGGKPVVITIIHTGTVNQIPATGFIINQTGLDEKLPVKTTKGFRK